MPQDTFFLDTRYRLKYWATRSSVRSFARTAHSFACSGLLALLAPSAALTCSLARSLCALPRSWESELLMSQNDLVLSHSASGRLAPGCPGIIKADRFRGFKAVCTMVQCNQESRSSSSVRSSVHSHVPLTHSLALHCSLPSRAPNCSLVCSLAHSLTSELVGQSHEKAVLNHAKWPSLSRDSGFPLFPADRRRCVWRAPAWESDTKYIWNNQARKWWQ